MPILALLISLTFSLSVFSQAEKNLERQNFLEKYRLTVFWEKMERLSRVTQEEDLENAEAVELGLTSEYNRLQEYLAAEKRVIDSIRAISSDEQRGSLSSILGQYMTGFRDGVQSIEFALTDLDLNQQEKNRRKKILKRELVAELNNTFQNSYFEAVRRLQGDSGPLSVDDGDFLVQWTFSVIPFLPEYNRTTSADKLHRYLWDNAMNGIFKNSTGRYSFGSYWLQSSFNRVKPGLDLNVIVRKSNARDGLRNMNVTIKFLPFEKGEKRLELQVCDITLSVDKKSCTALSFAQWSEVVSVN